MSADTLSETVVQQRRWHALLNQPLVRILTLLLLFTTAVGYKASQITGIDNNDIWWHLRTGLWILQNHSIPHTGLFSQHAASSWVASSWGFDVLTAVAYKLLGLRGLPSLLLVLTVAVAVVTFVFAYVCRRNFWGAVLQSAVAQYVIVGDLQLAPAAFSLLFFAMELLALLESRRSRDIRSLYWLPLLFVLWANLHAQFVNGLLLLLLFLLTSSLERILHNFGVRESSAPALDLSRISIITAVSVLATLLTPHTFHIYAEAFKISYSPLIFNYFVEMTPLGFRRPQDFVLALLVMLAFVVLGRQRSPDLFKLGLTGITLLIAFRIQRDAWMAVLPTVAVISAVLPQDKNEGPQERTRKWSRQRPVLAALTFVALGIAVTRLPGNGELIKSAGNVFPRKACDFIRNNRFPGPLFNDYNWGGFLIWYLPEYPVALDSRVTLYGNEATDNYLKAISGRGPLEGNPAFAQARTILVGRQSGVARALANLPVLTAQYRLAYEDDVAAVFVRR